MPRAILAAVLVAVALFFTPSATASPDRNIPIGGAPVLDILPPAAEPSGCPYARLGVAYYRGLFTTHQLRRGASVPTWRKPRNCADARYLANVWAKRAFQARQQVKLWREAQRQKRLARERQHPKWIALRLLGGDREQWGCLLYITDHENKAMDPTLDYGGGHGDTSEAYGIPQANPGTKMASAGPDWRTNPETQLRWMIGYCKARYGSVCGAAYSRRVNGMY